MTPEQRERFIRRVDEMSDRELAAMLRRFRRDPSPQTEKVDIMAAALRERKR